MKKFDTLQELFADPKRWTKGAYARNKYNTIVSFENPSATCFCLAGGLLSVYEGIDYFRAINSLYKGCRLRLSKFNDDPSTTIEDIQELVKKANV